MAGDHDLRRVVVVGDRTDQFLATLGQDRIDRSPGDGLGLFQVRTEQGGHRALAHRHRRLHRSAAQLQEARGRRQVDRIRRTERGIFAQRMTRDEVGLLGQPDAAFLLQHAQGRDGVRHDRGLGILGQGQLIGGSLDHQAIEVLAQRLVDLLEHLAGDGARLGQRLAHAHGLAALARKDECTHVRSAMKQ